MDRDFLTPDDAVGARGHHAHDQRVLRLGLQLVRGAAARTARWYPIDFANAVSRLAGHLAALSLPVAGQGEPALGDLLRGDRGAHARARSTGSRASRSPARDLPYREKLRSLRFDLRGNAWRPAEFEEFCDRHLAHLDAVAAEFFASPTARDAVRKKVAALYPPHEVEQFTELFVGRIRRWTELEGRG